MPNSKSTNAAVRAYLLAQSDVAALVSTRVYGGFAPEGFATQDATTSIIVDRAGGSSDPDLPIQEPTVSVKCYGASDATAEALYLVVRDALRRINNHTVSTGGVSYTLCSAIEDMPSTPEVEPDTEWNVVLSSWRITLK